MSSHLADALAANPSPPFLGSPNALKDHIEPILTFLFTARPTAVNLGAATRRLTITLNSGLGAGKDARTIAQELVAEGKLIAEEDVDRNKEMSKWGGDWLLDRVGHDSTAGLNVLTVCNTGSLATSVRTCQSQASDELTVPGIWHGTWIDHVSPRVWKIRQGLLYADRTLSPRL